MPAIDYMELLREEKRKQREKKKKKSKSSSSPSTTEEEEEEKKSTTAVAPTITTTSSSSSTVKNNGEEYVDDVQQQNCCESIITTSSTTAATNTCTIPKWSYPIEELEFSSPSSKFISRSNNNNNGVDCDDGLLLKVICENPKRISYCSPQSLFANAEDTNNNNNNNNIIQQQQQKRLTEWLNEIPSGHTGFNCWKTMKYGKRRVAMFGEEDSDAKLLPQPLQQIADQLVTQGIFSSNQPPNHVLLNEYQPSQGILAHTDGPLYTNKTATFSLNSDVLLIFTKRLTSNEIGQIQNQNQNQNNNIINKKKSDTTIITDDDEGTTTTVNCSKNSTDNSNMNQQQEQPNNDTPPSNSNNNNNTNYYMEVLLEAGSLIVFEDDAYINYCHEIKMDVLSDVTTTACLNAPPGIVIERKQRFSLTFRHKPPPSLPSQVSN